MASFGEWDMKRADALIIGAGQAGLAMSFCLGRLGIDHVVIERGRIAERWRSERWDSLRLLTPNWMSRLPGWTWRGDDPDGFMTMPEVIEHLAGYARHAAAPVETGTAVHAVGRDGAGFLVETSRGRWLARSVVIATGACQEPLVPPMAAALPGDIHQTTPSAYRNPSMLPPGGVLVVGAAASGVQIADELRRAGRRVVLSVGSHIRLPRLHRGRDILWWMDRAGLLDESAEAVADLGRARRQPSLQLVGRPDRRSIDLGSLQALGVRLVGRAVAAEGSVMRFADDLADTVGAAQRKLERLLARIDRTHADPPRPLVLAPAAPSLDLRRQGIGTVLWATGHRRDYGWLRVPVLDPSGEIVHRGGITPAAGLYVLGLRFLRTRKSSFIDGVGQDAVALSQALHDHLARNRAAAAA